MWIYLCDGQVIDMPKVTSFKLEPAQIVLFEEKKTVASFNRRDVFFCSNVSSPPDVAGQAPPVPMA
jgi:hypothetical protein